MKQTDPTTKALQDIATQLRRIADHMEQTMPPPRQIIIHVNEGATINGGRQDFAEDIVNATHNTESFNISCKSRSD